MQTHYTLFLIGTFAEQRKVSHRRRVQTSSGRGDGQTLYGHIFQAEGTRANRRWLWQFPQDLKVHMLEDANATKLVNRQQALKSAVQKGEPKCLGVTQLMLGLMVMSYSIPLHFTEVTEVVSLLVPWWSGLMFLTAGIAAIVLDKHCNMKILGICLLASVASAVLSVVAVVLYSVDLFRNPEEACVRLPYDNCDDHHYATKLSRGVKVSLCVFTLTETIVSVVLCCLLFKQRHSFAQYSTLNQAAPSTTEGPLL